VSILVLAGAASGQQGGQPAARQPVHTAAAPAPAGTSVAVIDIAYVFKNHSRFNSRMNDIKREIEQYDAFFREETRKFNAKREELTQFKPSTPEYKQKEVELAQMQSKMQVDTGLKRKEFLEQEARVYFDTYKEIEREVAVFAQRYRIGLVLRFNGDDMKPDDRASVLQGVNRAVVYHQNLDITEHILQTLNISSPAAPTGPAAPALQTAPNRPIVPQPGKSIQR
jgi:Skp family chaperone for outer membrane proteins